MKTYEVSIYTTELEIYTKEVEATTEEEAIDKYICAFVNELYMPVSLIKKITVTRTKIVQDEGATKELFDMMMTSSDFQDYIEAQWNALYKELILCDGNWNNLDFLSSIAIRSYLGIKYED